MTTARVLTSLVEGTFAGALAGAIPSTIGAGYLKLCGFLKDTPLGQIVKPATIGGTIAYSLYHAYDKGLCNNPSRDIPTPKEIRDKVGLSILRDIGVGLLGQGILTISGQPNPPMEQYVFALVIGTFIVDSMIAASLDFVEKEAQKKTNTQLKC